MCEGLPFHVTCLLFNSVLHRWPLPLLIGFDLIVSVFLVRGVLHDDVARCPACPPPQCSADCFRVSRQHLTPRSHHRDVRTRRGSAADSASHGFLPFFVATLRTREPCFAHLMTGRNAAGDMRDAPCEQSSRLHRRVCRGGKCNGNSSRGFGSRLEPK